MIDNGSLEENHSSFVRARREAVTKSDDCGLERAFNWFSVKRKMFNESLKKRYTIFAIGLTVEAIFKMHWEQ